MAIFSFASMPSIWRASEAAQARELAATVAPTERPLAYCRMPSRQPAVTTDQHVLAINLPSALHVSRALWGMLYAQIISFERSGRTVTRAAGVAKQVEVRVTGCRTLRSARGYSSARARWSGICARWSASSGSARATNCLTRSPNLSPNWSRPDSPGIAIAGSFRIGCC